ncbi:MAG: VOC family protein [Pseudomonadota bacterium]
MVTLGHVVFYVRNLEQSLSFYRDVVGLELVGRIFDGRAAMVELFVDDPRVDWKNDREWLQEPVKPLRLA